MVGESARTRRARVAIGVTTAAGLLAAFPGSAAAQSAAPPGWGSICSTLEMAVTADEHVAAARGCALALEKMLGPDDGRLPRFYAEIAERLTTVRGTGAAKMALPYRRRAHRTAQRLFGPDAPASGQAALDYARASILAGRCDAGSPEALRLLQAAARGMRGAVGVARVEAFRSVAWGYADSLAYRQAASLLMEAGGANGSGLRVADWERIGVWRHRVGELSEAAAAYRRALLLDPAPRDRLRIRQSLKQVLFELGDLEAVRSLNR